MRDQSSTPPPLLPAPAKDSDQQLGEFMQTQLETVRRNEGVARTAAKAEYKPKLVEEAMETGTSDAVLVKAGEWRELSCTAPARSTPSKRATSSTKDILTSRAPAEQSPGDRDALPGVTPARRQKSTEALAVYTGAEAPRNGAPADAATLQKQRDAAFAEVIRLRQESQFAADTALPWHDDQNLGIRSKFILPAGRAATG